MIGRGIAVDYSKAIIIQFEEVAYELLAWLEFYTPHKSENKGYSIRLYNDLGQDRFQKLQELHVCFSKILFIMFMGEGYNKDETYYSLADFEVDYIGDLENPENDLASIFELGRCWGEYISVFGHETADWSDRESPKFEGEATHELISRFKYLQSRRAEWQKKGASENSLIGDASKEAYKEFVSRFFPNGLDGRPKEHAYAECLFQIEKVVKLANKIHKNEILKESDQKEFDKLEYLMALTKEKNGIFYPYKFNSLKPTLSRLLKK